MSVLIFDADLLAARAALLAAFLAAQNALNAAGLGGTFNPRELTSEWLGLKATADAASAALADSDLASAQTMHDRIVAAAQTADPVHYLTSAAVVAGDKQLAACSALHAAGGHRGNAPGQIPGYAT